MASTSGKRCTLSIEQKLEILETLKSKKPDDGLKISTSTVRKYLKENFTEYNSYYDIEDMIEKNALINRTQ
ncbi:unnamed protein product, partial [Rotaria socialis]